ncbi:MAG: TRAP transporter large permease [Verrucomicrobiota bacterium]|nr:TRAP transporter large permease [Verrucomicrobiota bacterium]
MILLLISLTVLLLLGIPIAYALGMASAVYFLLVQPELLPVLPQRLFAGMQSYALIALPLFIFMGQVMNHSGITRRLLDLCLLLVGRLPGGLGMVNVSSSMLFGGISGSSTSDTASIGSVLIPEMKRRGYPLSYASGITVASSTMGMILPPSIPIVLYAVAAQASVGKLFLGGIIPGLLVGTLQLVMAVWISRRKNYPRESAEWSWQKGGSMILRSVHILFMPVFIVGVVVFGIATATESAALGVLYALCIGVFFLRQLTLKQLYTSLLTAAHTSAQIMIIIAFSQVFVWILALERAPENLTAWILELKLSPTQLLLLIVCGVLIIGTVIDVSPAILLLTPIFLPAITGAGISPILFGVVFVAALAVGACTPPVGTCLNVCALISGQRIGTIFMGAVPFLSANVAALFLMILFPELVLWLPRLFMP